MRVAAEGAAASCEDESEALIHLANAQRRYDAAQTVDSLGAALCALRGEVSALLDAYVAQQTGADG